MTPTIIFSTSIEKQFAETGSTDVQETPEVEVGSGGMQVVGQDLPSIKAGETYRYRIVATNTSPGDPVIYGSDEELVVPAAPEAGPGEACENEAVRTGPSAHLPDCRAYEQISPVDKGGTQDALKYGIAIESGAIPGEDGEHFAFMSKSTRWEPPPTTVRRPISSLVIPRAGK